MRSNLTTVDAVNSVRLSIRHPSSNDKVFVLVEGDSDIKALKKFLRPIVEITMIPGGVEKVVEALGELKKETSRVLAIRDLDFSFLISPPQVLNDLFATDHHDIEMTMLQFDDCILAILSEFLASHVHLVSQTRKRIFDCLKFYSYVKLFNATAGFSLNFKGFPFGTIFDRVSISLDHKKILDEVNRRSKDRPRDVTEQDILDTELRYPGLADELLVSGHDFVQVFSFFCEASGGVCINTRHIDTSLRSAFSLSHFRSTKLCRSLEGWGSKAAKPIVV